MWFATSTATASATAVANVVASKLTPAASAALAVALKSSPIRPWRFTLFPSRYPRLHASYSSQSASQPSLPQQHIVDIGRYTCTRIGSGSISSSSIRSMIRMRFSSTSVEAAAKNRSSAININSSKHAKIKLVDQIQSDKKFRDSAGLIFIEGKRNVFDSLQAHCSNRDSLVGRGIGGEIGVRGGGVVGEGIAHKKKELTDLVGKVQIDSVFVSRSRFEDSVFMSELNTRLPVMENTLLSPSSLYIVEDSIFNAKISSTVSAQGIAALVKRPFLGLSFGQWLHVQNSSSSSSHVEINGSRSSSSSCKLSSSLPLFILVLDGVADPGNVGSLIRTAGAFGVDCVVSMAGGCDTWTPKVTRTVMGSAMKVPVFSDVTWEDISGILSRLTPSSTVLLADGSSSNKSTAYDKITITKHSTSTSSTSSTSSSSLFIHPSYSSSSLHTSSTDVSSIPAIFSGRNPVFLVLGSEAIGISQQFKTLKQSQIVHIPMLNNTESLNVAAAGSILMSHLCKYKFFN